MLIRPLFSIAAALGVLLALFCVKEFTSVVSSAPLAFEDSGFYDAVTTILQNLFGEGILQKFFAEGPLFFGFLLAFSLFFVFLLLYSGYTTGYEKKAGIITLVSFGPSNTNLFLIATVVRNLVITCGYILVLFLFFTHAAAHYNLIVGKRFLISLLLVFFFSCSFYSLSVLLVALCDHPGTVVLLQTAAFAGLLFVDAGSLMLFDEYMQTFTGFVSTVFRWISPFYYLRLGLSRLQEGAASMVLLSILLQSLFSFLCLVSVHLLYRKRGASP
jgi:hypothetical protein